MRVRILRMYASYSQINSFYGEDWLPFMKVWIKTDLHKTCESQ